MKPKLLPCPFCGRRVKVCKDRNNTPEVLLWIEGIHKVSCPLVDIKTDVYWDEDKMIKEWNTRYEPKSGKVKELKERNKK